MESEQMHDYAKALPSPQAPMVSVERCIWWEGALLASRNLQGILHVIPVLEFGDMLELPCQKSA